MSVTPASGTAWPSGTVTVSDGSGGCQLTLVQDGPKAAGAGNCSIYGLHGGTYPLTASYAGSASFGSSASNPASVTIGTAPRFYADSPALTATSGEPSGYTFRANGDPAPGYALGAGAPAWLHVNPRTGAVRGTVPDRVAWFSYSVTATNSVGSVTAGPYQVHVRHRHAVIGTRLSCPPQVYAGQRGSCTLTVTNTGRFPARRVTAQVSLPSQLRARYCGQSWPRQDRTISGNTASQDLGTLRPGQAKALSVVFAAKSGPGLWGGHRHHTIKVKVTGSAAADNWFFGPGGRSYSAACVTIVPRGWWWAS